MNEFIVITWPEVQDLFEKEGFDEIASKLEPDIPVIGLDFLDPESAESIKKLGILISSN